MAPFAKVNCFKALEQGFPNPNVFTMYRMSLHCIVWYCIVLYYVCVWYCMEMLFILWYCIVLHVIALYCMVLHGIVLYLTVLHGIALLASARGLYLARHLSTLWDIIIHSCKGLLQLYMRIALKITPHTLMHVHFTYFYVYFVSVSMTVEH